MSQSYDASSIKALEGLEAVRKRPGMYIGSTSVQGLHHLVYEVVDNSIDEALAGFCSHVTITIHKDGSCSVQDDGRGIPTQIHSQYGVSALQVVLTKLHAGGKFDKNSYKVSGGLHGVGVSCVNALSEKFFVRVKNNGKIHEQEYSKGAPLHDLKVVGDSDETGTYVRFYPDYTIMEKNEFDFTTLSTRFRELAFLNSGLAISVVDERTEKRHDFKYEGGLVNFVDHLTTGKESLHETFYLEKEEDGSEVNVAFKYTDAYNETVFSFVNNINTVDGGTHVQGFQNALTRVMNKYGKDRKVLKESLSGSDVREGIVAIVSVKIPEPQFEGQTKHRLGSNYVRQLVDSVVSDAMGTFFEENPSVAKTILQKAVSAAHAREAAKKARDLARRKSVLDSGSLPGKLSDCSSRDPSKCEIFLVEGDSAGGNAKQARDRETQAVLPVFGKILNVEKARLGKVLSSDKLRLIISALGTNVGDEFDISKLRYHKIILMADADVDGSHIKILYLTLFYRYLRPLIENGHLYVAQSPLYMIRKGKKKVYALNDEEKDAILAEMGTEGIHIQRYKGLGEINADQLWETTLDPDVRTLVKITVEDAIEADQVVSMLMGDQVAPRREFIESHAKYVENLDI